MKYLKIQQDLLKMADARDGWKKKPFNVPWFQANGRTWVCFDGVICLGIPHKQFYLNREQVFADALPFEGGKKIIDMSIETVDADDTKMVLDRVVNNRKMKLHKFTIGETEIFINEDLMKYFDADVSKFTGNKKNQPLYVWEGEDLVGVVFPVNHSE